MSKTKMKGLKSIRYISFICAVLPVCICLASVFFMNEKIPMHYNINGEIDRYGSRYEFIIIGIIFTLFPLIMSILFNKLKISNLGKVIGLVGSIIMSTTFIVLIGVFIAKILSASGIVEISDFGKGFSFGSFCIGAIMLLLGSILSFLPQNKIIGIRTTATLSSHEIWEAMHNKFSGIMGVCGIAIMIACVFIQTVYSVIVLIWGALICIASICLALQRYTKKRRIN